MIDTKYGLHYSIPHSICHIVDNSAYVGSLPVVIADNPSLYASIVVSGSPMGTDNTVVDISRSDVLNTAYGMSSITNADRVKYGQTIDYAPSLIAQGVPVKMLRVTPDDATYGFSCIVVQWRTDPIDNKLHVRFKNLPAEGEPLPDGIRLDKFKNPERLNAALIKAYSSNDINDNGLTWKQRVFLTNIAAGRGSAYNYYTNCIDLYSQNKRPANVRYTFSTIDTRMDQTVEIFTASLVNIDNSSRADAIESVNNIVSKRIKGSSVIIPTINESAVKEVYNEYMYNLKTVIGDNSIPTDEFVKNAYVAMNINIFDMIYGHYIYNGGTDTLLPFYQVDMLDTSISRLSALNRVSTASVDFDPTNPTVLENSLIDMSYGVTRDKDSVYVGDVYLTTSGSSNTNPTITIVGAINQYTGSVTSISIPKLFPLDTTGEVDVTGTSTAIKTVFNDTSSADGSGSTLLRSMVIQGNLKVGDIVAQIVSSSISTSAYKLFTVASVTPLAGVYTLVAYDINKIYRSFDWSAHSSGASGVGNIIGKAVTDTAYARIGALTVDMATGNIYINDYDYATAADVSDFSKGRIALTRSTCKFGTCPSEVNITTDLIGSEYDVIAYADSNVSGWNITSSTLVSGGTGYAVNETLSLESVSGYTPTTTIKITSVDAETGAVTGYSFISTTNGETQAVVGASIGTSGGTGSGCTITLVHSDNTPVKFTGDPASIDRFVISGVQGSLFRLQKETIIVPSNYYSESYGINMSAELGGVKITRGSTGFFDDPDMNEIEFKWRYSALLVKAYRGELDPRIMSPTRVPAKYLFDGGTNTIVGQTILPYLTYTPADIINASTIFTADEKEEILFNPSVIINITSFEDIDVKQAMYDLMEYRVYQGIPDDKRPIGPGSGLSLHLDSGITDANTAMLVNTSFSSRFNNPNASWDIGGYVFDNISYTYTKRLVDNLFRHMSEFTVNKPFTGKYSAITPSEYTSYFPDIDTTDWDLRELLYNSGGNAWIPDINGNLTRRSQRTLMTSSETSDLVQESNMRTTSQFVYLLQNTIDDILLEYDDDGVLKTLSDRINNIFSNWIGNLVDDMSVTFERDKNVDGGDILVCYASLVFRGLILRVPIIVNINRRES